MPKCHKVHLHYYRSRHIFLVFSINKIKCLGIKWRKSLLSHCVHFDCFVCASSPHSHWWEVTLYFCSPFHVPLAQTHQIHTHTNRHTLMCSLRTFSSYFFSLAPFIHLLKCDKIKEISFMSAFAFKIILRREAFHVPRMSSRIVSVNVFSWTVPLSDDESTRRQNAPNGLSLSFDAFPFRRVKQAKMNYDMKMKLSANIFIVSAETLKHVWYVATTEHHSLCNKWKCIRKFRTMMENESKKLKRPRDRRSTA